MLKTLSQEESFTVKEYSDSNMCLCATVTSLSDSIVGKMRGVLLILLGGASLLLLIALVNLTNLMLVRAVRRKRETAFSAHRLLVC